MSSRIRVLAVSAVVLLGMTAQAQACFWPFCCGGQARPCAWGGPVGYGRPVAYRRGFYAGYLASSSSGGVSGCSTCGVSTNYGPSYYGSSCCSTGYSACGGCGTCSSCVSDACANCSTNYYPAGSDSNSTYSDSDDPTEAQRVEPRDDDFGASDRSTDNDAESTQEEDFEAPIGPAPGEPTNTEEPPMAGPLNIGPQLTWQVVPERSRVRVDTDIRTPRVARVDAATETVPNLSVLRVASFEN